SIDVTPAALELAVGSSELLDVTVRDANENALVRTPTFQSFSPSIADVDSEGRVTAHAPGEASIAVRSGNAPTALVTVNVGAVPVASLDLAPADGAILVGETLAFTATPRDAAGNELDDRTVTWASSNSLVATVDETGIVTGVAAGTATITAFSEGVSASAEVGVGAAAISLSASTVSFAARRNGPIPEAQSISITNGGAGRLTGLEADVQYLDGDGWLTVDLVGDSDEGTLSLRPATSALGQGSHRAEVVIRSSASGVAPQTVTVTYAVGSAEVARVEVSPEEGDVLVGGTLALSAMAHDAQGNELPRRTITWASLDRAVATVDAAGGVTGVAAGVATI